MPLTSRERDIESEIDALDRRVLLVALLAAATPVLANPTVPQVMNGQVSIARPNASTLQVTTIDVGNTATNVIPASAKAMLNIRFNDKHSGKSLTDWVRGALGEDLAALYSEFKRDEWARFCGAVTDWEMEMYRSWVP